eukprot:UN15573
MKDDCPYTCTEEHPHGWEAFENDVQKETERIFKEFAETNKIKGCNITMSHPPYKYQLQYLPEGKSNFCTTVTDCIKGSCCSCCCDDPPDKYKIYRSDNHDYNRIIVSSRIMTDHMPP